MIERTPEATVLVVDDEQSFADALTVGCPLTVTLQRAVIDGASRSTSLRKAPSIPSSSGEVDRRFQTLTRASRPSDDTGRHQEHSPSCKEASTVRPA